MNLNTEMSDISLTVAIFSFTIVYSWVIMTQFGHSSYWNIKISRKVVLADIYKLYLRFLRHIMSHSKARVSNDVATVLSQSKLHLLTDLDKNVLMTVLKHLNYHELHNVASTCRYLLKEVRNPIIGESLYKLAFPHWTEFERYCMRRRLDIQIGNLNDFPNLISKYLVFLLYYETSTECACVQVGGTILHIPTSFIAVHPGGGSIINHYRSRDASVVFNVANHSTYALNEMTQYVYWESKRYLGQGK